MRFLLSSDVGVRDGYLDACGCSVLGFFTLFKGIRSALSCLGRGLLFLSSPCLSTLRLPEDA